MGLLFSAGFEVCAAQRLLWAFVADQFHLVLADRLVARVVTQLDVFILNVLLEGLHHARILERRIQLVVRVVFAQNFDKLTLDQHQYLADSAVSQARGNLDLVRAISTARGRIASPVLRDVLTDDNVIEALWVLAS